MDRKTMQKLRFDRRLIQRKDWVSPDDLARELAELPDVSDKISETDTESDDAPSGSGESNPA